MCLIKLYLLLFSLQIFPGVCIQGACSVADTLQTDSIWKLKLHEVKVIAHENRSTSTSSVINSEAIRHIQAFSLSDLMQLLPGGTTPKVSFKFPDYVTIRHLGTDKGNNSLGTGISIDGVRISTNNDLQQNIYNNDFEKRIAQYGTDTRNISTDNIESLEIIRGIPSVRYGDITSGMIIIHTHKQVRPYVASIRITPGIKAFNAGKGWQAGPQGIVNVNVNYTRANSDISTTENIFHRIVLQTSYLIRLNTTNPFTLETGIDGDITLNNNPENCNFQPGEYIKARRQSFRFRLSGKWLPGKRLLSELNWKVTTEYGHSISENNRFYSGLYTVGTSSIQEQEKPGFFIPPQHWEREQIESIPLNITTSLTAGLFKKRNNFKCHTLLGLEWTSEGNKGKGKNKEYHTPSLPSQEHYNFRTLPFFHHYAVYMEEKIETARFTFEGGVRLTGISIPDINFRPSLEPRVNLNYLILQRPDHRILRQLRLRGGFGLLRKIPTWGYLYQEPVYKNFTSFRDTDSGLAVLTTFVSQLTGTQSLKLPENLKAEIGLSGLAGDISFDVTGFYEQLQNGFGESKEVRPVSYRIYNNPNRAGQQSAYQNKEVYINGSPAGYMTDSTFLPNPTVHNHFHEYKGGIEFSIRSNYILPLSTTFILDGAWIVRRVEDRSISPDYNLVSTGGRSYPRCAFYENNASYTFLQRLNTTLRAVTEIPSLRLTSTLALQTVWLERSQKKINPKTHSHLYMQAHNGQRVENGIEKDSKNLKYLDPISYMDTQGKLHPFTSDMVNDPAFQPMVRKYYSRTFLRDSYAPYFMLNLRITKEIGQHFCLVFFANNLAKINPQRYKASIGGYVEMNPPAFYGAELQIKL